jgi:molecular chaperone GrpE (heat shock protein)
MIEPEEIELMAAQTEQHDAQETPSALRGAAFGTTSADSLDSAGSSEKRPEMAADPESDRNLPSAPTLAQLMEEAETAHRRLDTHHERIDRTERDLQEVAEMLLNQVAELETQSQQAVKALEAQSAQILRALEARVEAAERAQQEAERRVMDAETQVLQARAQQDVYQQAWQSAPLTLRLKFVRELVPESHSLQNVLKEAAALEELRRRGQDLEAWVSNYPALFADAAHALLSEHTAAALDKKLLETYPADILAAQTLQETREALEATLQALGITWVVPAPGDPVLTEHEVIGEESSAHGAGRVARLRRRGFRFQGRLLPAQVVRAAASPTGASVTAPSEGISTAAVTPVAIQPREETVAAPAEPRLPATAPASPTSGGEDGPVQNADALGATQNAPDDILQKDAAIKPNGSASGQAEESDAGELPDWLRMLSQRTFGCDLPAVSRLAEQLFALKALPTRIMTLPDEEACGLLTGTLQPLLPLLGLRYADGLPDIPETWGTVFLEARQPLLEWLEKRLGLVLVAPARGEDFDARTMEALETRRTVHAKEDETVAKLERIGVVWRERPLIRAQVVRYTTGGIA